MYSTCLFCTGRLGANAVVEEFPVGRRLAFDPAKGRLWVLCPRCRQWNLSPLETRWEALEALERLYRDTPRRYSTEQIGMAKHREGLEVVRIGRARRPEYAAWRYGGALLRRRRRAVVLGTATVATGAVLAGGLSAGLVAGGAFQLVNLGFQGGNFYRQLIRTAARVEGPDGAVLRLRDGHVKRAELIRESDEWALSVPHATLEPVSAGERLKDILARGLVNTMNTADDPTTTLRGADAVRAAGRILPVLNRTGASSRLVGSATAFVEEAGTPDEAFRRAAATHPSAWRALGASLRTPQHALFRLPGPVRLGLEMAAHEESERRALEGELARLEAEWREAEEVAAIADDLLLPERVRRFFDR